MDDEHLRYAFVAYKKGALDHIGEQFKSHEMTPAEFKDAFIEHSALRYDDAWVFYATSRRGEYEPVGYISITRTKFIDPVFIVDIVMFPWASTRNKLESIANWVNDMRRLVGVTYFAPYGDEKRFCEHLCRHGIVRRVGTKRHLFGAENCPEFEAVRIV